MSTIKRFMSYRIMPSLQRYFHTIKHLKPKQIVYRIYYKFKRRKFQLSENYQVNAFTLATSFLNKPCSTENDHTFIFLGEKKSFPQRTDWNCTDVELLWKYNLHYFDYINSEECSTDISLSLIRDWCELGIENHITGMDPYPTSLRIVNWVKFELKNKVFDKQINDCLYRQCYYLKNNIEHHILANHLLANAKALVFSGLYFSNPESAKWLETGLSILKEQLEEQILDDGAHYERSPMYHCIVLEDLVDLYIVLSHEFFSKNESISSNKSNVTTLIANSRNDIARQINIDELVSQLKVCIERMIIALSQVTHPDGSIAFFNDSAFGIASEPESVVNYALGTCDLEHDLALNARTTELNSPNHTDNANSAKMFSGFNQCTQGPFTLISNVAPVEPKYQPAHTHADTLSFELSIAHERVLVNSGTSTYAINDLRRFQRSTRAHNTVELDGKNSSDVWSSFRVAKKAAITLHSTTTKPHKTIIAGAHNGYRNFFGGAAHKRVWELSSSRLTIRDSLAGSFESAKLYFYFHPAVSMLSPGTFQTSSGAVFHWSSSETNLNWKESFWYPKFGTRIPNTCLEITTSSSDIANHLELESG